jgi:hypothetical protein
LPTFGNEESLTVSVLLITYDLKKPGQDYANVLAYIKSFAWAHLSESTYAIETALDASSVYNGIRQLMDENDQVYVVQLAYPFAGFGPPLVNDWLTSRLLPLRLRAA